MDNNTPVAPDGAAQTTPAAAPSEATQNTNLEAAPQAPATSPAPVQDELDRFIEVNGGRDKMLAKMKQAISDPVAYARARVGDEVADKAGLPQIPQANPEPQQAQNPVPPMAQPAQGFMSPTEIAVRQYGTALSNEYKDLGDYVSKGQFMNDMQNMGITTVDSYGNINDNAIRQFLDMKSQIQAAKAPAVPVTATPTVEYYNVANGTITSMEQALAVKQQNMTLGAGMAPHPLTQQANEFISKHFVERSEKRGKR